MLGKQSDPAQSLREAVKLSGAMAALFFIASFGCWYWAYSRGAFGIGPDEHLVNLRPGTTIDVRLSIRNRADHDVEISYSRDVADDGKHLWDIEGKATLRYGHCVIAQAKLPVDHSRSTRDDVAMVLFTVAAQPRNDYVLSLEIEQIPPELARSPAIIRTEIEHLYYLIFWQTELAALGLLLIASLCVFLSIRWRATVKGNSDITSLAD